MSVEIALTEFRAASAVLVGMVAMILAGCGASGIYVTDIEPEVCTRHVAKVSEFIGVGRVTDHPRPNVYYTNLSIGYWYEGMPTNNTIALSSDKYTGPRPRKGVDASVINLENFEGGWNQKVEKGEPH